MSEQEARPRRLVLVEVDGMGTEGKTPGSGDTAAMWECLEREGELLDELERVTAELRKVRQTKEALVSLGVEELRAGLARRTMRRRRGTL